jgi:hypothetical protein
VTDRIAQALDEFVPAFDSADGNWQAIVDAARRSSLVLADRRMPVARRPAWRRTAALALAALAMLALGVAWAAGAWSPTEPLALFETNPQGGMQKGIPVPDGYWDQTVIPGSVKQVASVDIPDVGPVAFWHADTEQGGWCAGLQMSDGYWFGMGGDPQKIDGGGVIPGCFPTRDEHGFDWLSNFIDARPLGGQQWQIRYGKVVAPGAVKVTDVVSGASTHVVDGDLFMLLIPEPNPPASTPNSFPNTDLVAYDQAGNVVADLCPHCANG